MDCAVVAFWGISGGWVVFGRGSHGGVTGCPKIRSTIVFTIVVTRVGYIFLRDGREVNDGVRQRVGTTESENDTRWRGWVRECYVATRIRKERSCVPCFNKLEVLKLGAATETLEGLLDTYTGGAHTVGYIYYACKLLKFHKQLYRYRAVVARVWRR